MNKEDDETRGSEFYQRLEHVKSIDEGIQLLDVLLFELRSACEDDNGAKIQTLIQDIRELAMLLDQIRKETKI